MRFTVRHRTEYRYASPVRLGPHLLRLTPRAEGVADLSHRIEVHPEPATRVDETDAHGNLVTRLGFEGETSSLRIDSAFTLDSLDPPAADAAPPPLPWEGAATPLHPRLRAFAERVAEQGGDDAAGFLDHLNRTLYAGIERRIRPDGDARPPEETLRLGVGACRDLTLLFMAVAAARGVRTRFASGYQARTEQADGRRYLHAWPEAHLPGIGWRGYDPTHGLPVGETHVALAVADRQAETMPVEGGFFADAPVASTLDFALSIETEA